MLFRVNGKPELGRDKSHLSEISYKTFGNLLVTTIFAVPF